MKVHLKKDQLKQEIKVPTMYFRTKKSQINTGNTKQSTKTNSKSLNESNQFIYQFNDQQTQLNQPTTSTSLIRSFNTPSTAINANTATQLTNQNSNLAINLNTNLDTNLSSSTLGQLPDLSSLTSGSFIENLSFNQISNQLVDQPINQNMNQQSPNQIRSSNYSQLNLPMQSAFASPIENRDINQSYIYGSQIDNQIDRQSMSDSILQGRTDQNYGQQYSDNNADFSYVSVSNQAANNFMNNEINNEMMNDNSINTNTTSVTSFMNAPIRLIRSDVNQSLANNSSYSLLNFSDLGIDLSDGTSYNFN